MGRNYALTTGKINAAKILYEGGKSALSIANDMGVSVTAVINSLKLSGATLRTRAESAAAPVLTLESIKARCEVDARSECWNWTGCIQSNGYGRLTIKRRQYYAHRVAYQLATGNSLGRKLARHDCDNRRCCNPEHIQPGTHKDNMRDALERNRVSRGIKHSLAVTPGARARAKLTMAIAKEIRQRAANGETAEMLALEFKTDKSNARLIIRNKAWRESASPFPR